MTVPFLRYTVLRLALFVAALLGLSLVGVERSILLLVLAAVISMAMSYLLLGKQRRALAEAVATKVEGRLPPRDPDAEAEDAVLDAGARDAGARDAGARDAGARDAGARDAGQPGAAPMPSERQTDGQQ